MCMHQNFPFLQQKWARYGRYCAQKLSSLALDKQFKPPPPPILRVLVATKPGVRTGRAEKHNVPQLYALKCVIFYQKYVNYTRTPEVNHFIGNITCSLNGPNAHFLRWSISSTMVLQLEMFRRSSLDGRDVQFMLLTSARRRGRAQARGHTLPARQACHAGGDQPPRSCPGPLCWGTTDRSSGM